ncbi:MAG: BACON domain-containing protein [Bacteroidales bacterium]|nr:BACON domain-containing protein [Bacteroidales bacterium]
MRKWIVYVLVLLSLAACQKPYVTQIDLGVNHEAIDLPSFEQGHCFITVFSNGSWTIGLESPSDWARLGQSSGEGIAYVRFDYDENLTGEDRSVTVLVSGMGKECKIVVTQPKES